MGVSGYNQALAELDNKLGRFYETVDLEIPAGGWLRAVRLSLGMTLAQLGKRLGKNPVTVREIEEREANKSVTLRKCIEVGDALGLHFVYGFVPRAGSLDRLIDERALRLAGDIVRRKAPSWMRELQKIGGTALQRAIREKADELRTEMPKSFWD
jgi:predicted DNA-binding mobile mystery protein A